MPLCSAFLGLEATKTHVLDMEVLVDAVFGAFHAQPRLLDAPERGLRSGQQALVDPHDAHLQALSHPPDLAGILREEVAWREVESEAMSHSALCAPRRTTRRTHTLTCQPHIRGVGDGHGLVLRVEPDMAEQNSDWLRPLTGQCSLLAEASTLINKSDDFKPRASLNYVNLKVDVQGGNKIFNAMNTKTNKIMLFF